MGTEVREAVLEHWEQRLAEVWGSIDQRSEEEFLTLIENLAAELPPESSIGIFERAASLDSTGHSDLAVPLYRHALIWDSLASAVAVR